MSEKAEISTTDTQIEQPSETSTQINKVDVPQPALQAKLDGSENETIYVRNLNETVKLATMKESLRNLYSNFGEVLDVVAHKNIRMRGQAFIAFNNKHVAKRALTDTQNFPLYGQPLKVDFAKCNADAVFRRQKRTEELEKHLQQRKEAKRGYWLTSCHITHTIIALKRKENYIRLMKSNRVKAGQPAERDEGTKAAQQKQQQMPDEYLPPNVILFIQNLPSGTSKEKLEDQLSYIPSSYTSQ